MNTATKMKADKQLERLQIHIMSKIQLQNEIDKRLNAILLGEVQGEALEIIKAEASEMAKMQLRRG